LLVRIALLTDAAVCSGVNKLKHLFTIGSQHQLPAGSHTCTINCLRSAIVTVNI